MSLNYAALTLALSAQTDLKPISITKKPMIPKSDIKCYNCGERGHYQSQCLSEKKKTYKNQNVNMIEMESEPEEVSDTKYEPVYEAYEGSDEEEVFITTRSGKTYPYIINRKEQKEKQKAVNKRSESQKEIRILKPKIKQYDKMQIDDVPKLKQVAKPKMKRQPSVIDQVAPYDISQDILNMQASGTIAQWLQYPDQKKKFANIIKRSIKDVNFAGSLEN